MPHYIKLILWVGIYLAVSFGIGQLTQSEISGWYQNLEKPFFNPPNFVFPIVWSMLYVMTAIAGWNLWRVGAAKSLKTIFICYTLMNWAWTPIFFGAHQITLGLIWVIVLSLVNLTFIIQTWTAARLSAVLVIPLLLWTSFASVLSYYIWVLNS